VGGKSGRFRCSPTSTASQEPARVSVTAASPAASYAGIVRSVSTTGPRCAAANRALPGTVDDRGDGRGSGRHGTTVAPGPAKEHGRASSSHVASSRTPPQGPYVIAFGQPPASPGVPGVGV